MRCSSRSASSSALAVLVLLAWAAPAFAQGAVRVLVVSPYPQAFQIARQGFETRFGAGRVDLHVTSALQCTDVENAEVLYIHGAFWSGEMEACAADVRRRVARGLRVGGTIPAIFQASWRVTASAELNSAAAYLRFGGEENLVGFLAALYNAASPAPARLRIADAKPQAEAGIYHPKAPEPFFSLDDYLAWYRAAQLIEDDAPLVGITFFQTALFFGDLAHIDALIASLERRGIGVIPAYGWPLEASEPFLVRNGQPVVDLLFCLNLLMPSPENAALLADYGVHTINLTTTTASFEQWSTSRQGLPPGRVSLQLGTPERTGATEPILVATTRKLADGESELVPVAERIESAAARAERWIALRHKRNRDKRVALVYFNNPPGKGLLGASYLDLFPSLRNILAALQSGDYGVGDGLPSEERLKELLLLSGRNVGDYAPGELDAMVRDGHVVLLPIDQYERWYQELPPAFRTEMERAWGKPSQSRLMTVSREGRRYFVIAGVRMGNVFLGPQPLRDTLEASPEMAHSADRPAPHSYVAYYLWLRHAFDADAIVHIGRHGTLEWLPGKDVAQSELDAGEVLIGDRPHLYYYLVDGGGEFLQAKRRSQAVVISHLTPLLAGAGLGPDFLALQTALDNRARLEEGSSELKAQYEREILDEARRLRLFEKLDLAPSIPADDAIERIEHYLDETAEQSIPLGMHAIGGITPDPVLADALRQFLLASFSGEDAAGVEERVDAWVDDILQRRADSDQDPRFGRVRTEAEAWVRGLRESGARELAALLRLLDGRNIPTGVSGDPLRTPDAVPTGRNMHDLDPRNFPTKAAWDVGKRMASSLLDEQRDQRGRYPETVSFVLWYGESNRTQGIAEAQALYLLGVEPVWNGRGQVDDVKLIPSDELGRPRVDVVLTMSGLYRDGLPEKLDLLDRAVKLVADAPEDNVVRRNAARVEQELRTKGVPVEEARAASRARLFGPAPQAFGVGLSSMMESSQDDNDQKRVAGRYLENMNYAYGQGLWGSKVAGNLESQLAKNSVVVHSRSTNLYGVLDNDETYQFAGGLNAAATLASGQAPDLLVSNVRRGGRERFETMSTFVSRELDSRTWNPKWIEAMKTAGYSGAREIAKEVEHLYGLRATAPTQVDSGAWQQMLDVYVKDKFNLGLSTFFERENPFAQQMVAARLLEINRQGVAQFSALDQKALLRTFVQSVNRFGIDCYANVCANERLRTYIVDEARRLSAVPAAAVTRLEERFRTIARVEPPAPRTATVAPDPPRAQFTLSAVTTLVSRLPDTLPVSYRFGWSWLLFLLPALVSPIYALWPARSEPWSYESESLHRGA